MRRPDSAPEQPCLSWSCQSRAWSHRPPTTAEAVCLPATYSPHPVSTDAKPKTARTIHVSFLPLARERSKICVSAGAYADESMLKSTTGAAMRCSDLPPNEFALAMPCTLRRLSVYTVLWRTVICSSLTRREAASGGSLLLEDKALLLVDEATGWTERAPGAAGIAQPQGRGSGGAFRIGCSGCMLALS